MNQQIKQLLFSNFLFEWGDAFEKAKEIFQQVLNYKQGEELLQSYQPFLMDDYTSSQLEWVSLVPQFDHILEQIFFKSYWMPLQLDTYELYIDLSDPEFSLFTIDYFWLKPYQWFKKPVYSSLFQLLEDIQEPAFNVSEKLQDIKNQATLAMHQCLNNRKQKGLAGNLEIEAWERDDIFVSENLKIHSINANTLEITGCNARIFGFLPPDIPISVKDFHSNKTDDDQVPEEVNKISSLCFFIDYTGVARIYHLSLVFDNDPLSVGEYVDDTFYLYHKDSELIRQIKDKAMRMIDGK